MDTEFLVQMRQSNKCGSVRNDEIFNLHLGSDAGPIFCKYPCILPLKDKRFITITNAFQKVLNEFNCKTNQIWVEKGSEFHNKLTKSWLEYMI